MIVRFFCKCISQVNRNETNGMKQILNLTCRNRKAAGINVHRIGFQEAFLSEAEILQERLSDSGFVPAAGR